MLAGFGGQIEGRAYSLDLRERVVGGVAAGEKLSERWRPLKVSVAAS